jgi:hypothetical protein
MPDPMTGSYEGAPRQRKSGASLAAMAEATGWLPHTTRAALTGLRQKGLRDRARQERGGVPPLNTGRLRPPFSLTRVPHVGSRPVSRLGWFAQKRNAFQMALEAHCWWRGSSESDGNTRRVLARGQRKRPLVLPLSSLRFAPGPFRKITFPVDGVRYRLSLMH